MSIDTQRGDPAPRLTEKARKTRSRLVVAALQLTQEVGYERATMREIAKRAGTSLGNAYYYFPSKGHLVQSFYRRTHEEHVVGCAEVLATDRTFRGRLLGVMRAKLATIRPYHGFSMALFRAAADTDSPLNPFSDASGPTRREAIALFAELVAGSRERIPVEFAEELPELLWLYHMGVLLFWIHDKSPQQQRSLALVEQTVPLIASLVAAASLPGLGAIRKQIQALLHSLRPEPKAARG